MKPKEEKKKRGPKEFSFELEHLDKLPVYCYSMQEGRWIQDYWFDSEHHELVGIPQELDPAPPTAVDVANIAIKMKQLFYSKRGEDERFGWEIDKAAELLGEINKSYEQYRKDWMEVNRGKLDVFVCVDMLMHKIRTKNGVVSKSPSTPKYFINKVRATTRSIKSRDAMADFEYYASGRAVVPFRSSCVSIFYSENECKKLVGKNGLIRRHVVVDFCRDLKLKQLSEKQRRPKIKKPR